METYDPILEATTLQKGRLGSPRPRPGSGVAHVLYGGRREPLVLTRGGRLTLGESIFGGYSESFVVDLSVKRLERAAELPCRGDAHNFTATLALTCWVNDPRDVVQYNIRDAGAVLWPAVIDPARRVSRTYSLADTAEAERAIAERLAGVVLHPAFVSERVEVRLSPDPQAIEIGRRGTEINLWNSLIDNPLAAAHLAAHPGDVHGALDVVRQMRQQYEESVAAYEHSHGRIGPELRAQRRELLEHQARQLGVGGTEFLTEGVQPVLLPREVPTGPEEDEDHDA